MLGRSGLGISFAKRAVALEGLGREGVRGYDAHAFVDGLLVRFGVSCDLMAVSAGCRRTSVHDRMLSLLDLPFVRDGPYFCLSDQISTKCSELRVAIAVKSEKTRWSEFGEVSSSTNGFRLHPSNPNRTTTWRA